MDSARATGSVTELKPWTNRSPRLRMKPTNGCRYARVDMPGLSFRDDAVGKLSVAPAETRLPDGRSSSRTALATALRLPKWVVSKPGPPGTAARDPVTGSG